MTDVFSLLKRRERKDFLYEALEMGRVMVSIQASPYHYCKPKEMLEDPHDYEEFEILYLGEGDYLPDKFSRDGIRGYVPKAEVQALWDILEQKARVHNRLYKN